MSDDKKYSLNRNTSKQISFDLWAALLFIPIEIPVLLIILTSFKFLIPYLSNLPAHYTEIGYLSLLMPLIFIALVFIPHKHGTFRHIPRALWIPGLSFLVEVLVAVIFYGFNYILLAFYPNTAFPGLSALGSSLFPLLLLLLVAIPIFNIFALWKYWRHMPLPFRLATTPLYGLIILANLITPIMFFLLILFYRGP